MIKKEIKSCLISAVKLAQAKKALPEFDLPEILVDQPEIKEHGDYSTNIAFSLAKSVKRNPKEVASIIVKFLKIVNQKKLLFEKIEIADPGFINFFISKNVLTKELRKILREENRYSSSKIGRKKTIIIDYSSPNIAKPFGIGHLRSTIIGQAIYNLYKFLGYKVIGDNHIGDWGTQFGKLIFAIKAWGDEKKIAKNPIKELNNLYIKFHKEVESKPELEEKGRLWFKKLEEGDKEARRIWKKCVKWSLEEFNRIYELLGIKFDLILGESFYQPMTKEIIREALRKGIAFESEGAIVIRFPNDALPPLMIQKSDGTTLYQTRDLATIKYRQKRFKPYKIIYEVGADQTLYFKQIFWAAELLGWGKRKDYVHVAHGMMRLKTGRMRTRKGEIILLEDVLKKAIERARRIIEEKNPGLNKKEKDKIAKAVGIGAVKYNDLSQHYSKDIIFDWGKVLNLKGNSGPYLQYTYARARSILRKSKTQKRELENLKEFNLKDEKEIAILKLLSQFPETVERAAESYSPNILANFLFQLAHDFNTFYESLPVLSLKDKKLMKARLALTAGVCQILKNGLNLLGIETPEKI
jgi:arginyl-tRNA synthetase